MKKYLFIPLMIFILNVSYSNGKDYIDKVGVSQNISSQMVLVEVEYRDFEGKEAVGLIVVNKAISKEIVEIFKDIKKSGFQIEKIVPISEYEWNDEKSMEDNNTSSYNYRFVSNTTKLSNHSFGMAIDINPRYNPMIVKGIVSPNNGSYSKDNLGTIFSSSEIVKIFKKNGWKWGGDYKSLKDYQHFEKIIK